MARTRAMAANSNTFSTTLSQNHSQGSSASAQPNRKRRIPTTARKAVITTTSDAMKRVSRLNFAWTAAPPPRMEPIWQRRRQPNNVAATSMPPYSATVTPLATWYTARGSWMARLATDCSDRTATYTTMMAYSHGRSRSTELTLATVRCSSTQ